MNWLIWRQYRKQLLIFVCLLLIFAAITVPSGLHFWHNYQHILSTCSQTDTCGQIRNAIFSSQTDNLILNFVKLSLLGLPILLGLFVGVPLIAKEYTDNTNKLAWTQGISRRKWLTAKFVWILLATVIYAGAFAALATWFFKTGNAINHDKFAPLAFSSQGTVPVAVALFAVAVGAMFGTWFKKLLPAFGAALALLIILQIAIPLAIRPHYQALQISHLTLDTPEHRGRLAVEEQNNQDWTISVRQVAANGEVLDTNNPPQQCVIKEHDQKIEGGAFAMGSGPLIGFACLKSLGYYLEVKYQPAYRYWNFQRMETALYLALASTAVIATYWLVLKRDA